jgi:excinuclease ABC subunit A
MRTIEMNFMPDVYVPCDACKGKRYNRETLEVKFREQSIADVLDMTVEAGAQFFKAVPSIREKLDTLVRVGLGYISVGQQATTLSGGEAQRVKLSKELSRRATGRTLYILDEPTTGLHFHDVKKLLEVLHELVDNGNTVIVIEHNLEVIKTADWIIDLGPKGGDGGGEIVATGTPEDVAKVAGSYTGQYLKTLLKGRAPQKSAVSSAKPKAKVTAKSARKAAPARKSPAKKTKTQTPRKKSASHLKAAE